MEAESQVVLNILTDHKFHVPFKKIGKVLGMVHMHGWGQM
jgi:hypothetical protein